MEREELLSKINEKLGSTKLSLSERTVNDFVDDMLVGITDDTQFSDEFLGRKVSLLKSLDGNLHSDVAKQVELYKQSYKPLQKETEESKPETANSEWEEKFTKLESQFQELLAQRETEKAAAGRARLLDDAVATLKEKFKKADMSVNSYILKQSLRDLNVSGEENVSDIASKLETEYYKNIKEAGIEFDSPMGGVNTVVNKKAENAKSRREALKKEFAARGYLPKKEK